MFALRTPARIAADNPAAAQSALDRYNVLVNAVNHGVAPYEYLDFMPPRGARGGRLGSRSTRGKLIPRTTRRCTLRCARLAACARPEYPVLDIWRANQPEGAARGSINLANGATHALLHRRAQVVQCHRLSAAQAALLKGLARDLTLGEALDAAQNVNPAIDLGAALRHFGALGVLAQATRQQ